MKQDLLACRNYNQSQNHILSRFHRCDTSSAKESACQFATAQVLRDLKRTREPIQQLDIHLPEVEFWDK